MRADGGEHLVAVVALGDDLEAVVGSEDAGDAGAHDGLVVDDERRGSRRDDVDVGRGERAGGRRRASRRPSGRPRARPPSARARSRHADEAEVQRLGIGRRRRAAVVGHDEADDVADRTSTRERRRGCPARGGRRWPAPRGRSGAAPCRPGPSRSGGRRGDRRVDGEPGAAVLVDERRRGRRRRPATGRCRARRCAARRPWRGSGRGSPGRRSRRRRAPARPRRRRAAQHVAGAGDVEQHGGERVPGQVVQLAGDAPALLGHGLLGERLPGALRAARSAGAGGPGVARART